MSNTIQVEVFTPGVGQLESINQFFEEQKIGFKVSDDDVLFMELKQMPEILIRLESVGYHEEECVKWSLVGVSEKFVELYVAYFEGDGCIFIPWDNVLAVHTIDEKCLKAVAMFGQSGRKKRGN